MRTQDRFDIAIVGAGSAGLTGAGFAAQLGARVALLEKDRIGGDCTWTGCVPSKTLLRSAHTAHELERASTFGLEAGSVRADMPAVHARVSGAIAQIYEHTTPEALRLRGIDVFIGDTAFLDACRLRCGEERIAAKHIVICTGAHASVPDVRGLSSVPYLTYGEMFDLTALPAHLLIMGAGPLGVEMAQAFRRLGAGVTIVGPGILEREEPEAQSLVKSVLEREGIEVILDHAVEVRQTASGIELRTEQATYSGDALLVAAGRSPNVEGLGLEHAGVAHDAEGIHVDRYLRTSVKNIYACGDVIGGPQFSHLAGWQGFYAVRNALIAGRSRGRSTTLPAVTFSDPEVARVGMIESEARDRFGDRVHVHTWPMTKLDRAVCDGEQDGFIKLLTDRRRKILGATIVATRAGEMIAEITLAIHKGMSVDDIAGTIHAYPTWTSGVQLAALDVMMARFTSSRLGHLIRRMSGFG